MARGLMPKPPSYLSRSVRSDGHRLCLIAPSRLSAASAVWLKQHARHLANVRDADTLTGVGFTRSPQPEGPDPFPSDLDSTNDDSKRRPPDKRTLKLGETIRILHDRLPNLLINPLPQEILSPQIKLNLFPSTHPHLPSVTGKIAYSAALWTAPVAWGRVPLVGNVKLSILSERMIKNGTHAQLYNNGEEAQNEELIVRWRTCGKNSKRDSQSFNSDSPFSRRDLNPSSSLADSNSIGAGGTGNSLGEEAEEFSGLFIFSFDSEGRILSHTIEHSQQGGNWEKMTSRVINVTDWLLGRAKWRRVGEGSSEEGLALGYGVCGIDGPTDVCSRFQRNGERRDTEDGQ